MGNDHETKARLFGGGPCLFYTSPLTHIPHPERPSRHPDGVSSRASRSYRTATLGFVMARASTESKAIPQTPAVDRPWCGLVIVLLVALLVRVLAFFTLPLIITNDGVWYLLWSQELAGGSWPELPAARTPGYVCFLAGVFRLMGTHASAVLLAQHVVGLGLVACIWKVGRDIGGHRVAIGAGLIAALDPWLLGFESYALSDSLGAALVLGALTLVSGNRSLITSLLAGLLVGFAVLVRPSLMAWWPGLFLAALLAPVGGWAFRPVRGVVFAAACVIAVMPWYLYNADRGVRGLTQTDGLALWGGLARWELLTSDFQVPEEIEHDVSRLLEGEISEDVVMGVYTRLGQIEGVDRAELLREWSTESLREDPFGYAIAAAHAGAWQANTRLSGSRYRHDETRWMMRRLGGTDTVEGIPPNFTGPHPQAGLKPFEDHAPAGPLAFLYRAMPGASLGVTPHAVAFLASIAAMGLLLWRRRPHHALLLASSFSIVIGHALLLQPFSRYSLSAWPVWWIGLCVCVQLGWPHVRRLVRDSVPE